MTEGTKFDQGKLDWTFLPLPAMEEVIRVYTYGANKYGRDNFRQGMAHSRMWNAMIRHCVAYWQGEDLDPESGLHHMAHAACSAIMLIDNIMLHPHLDDRGIDKFHTKREV